MSNQKKHKKAPRLSPATIARHCGASSSRLESSEKLLPFMPERVHVQTGNTKTGASVGEATAAVLTCLHDIWTDWTAAGVRLGIERGIIPPCAISCYAERGEIRLPDTFSCDIRNTHMRRRDAVAYYRVFFDFAVRKGINRVRVNESGDFETADQVRALFAVAREYPAVAVWGYTQKPSQWIANAPENVKIRVSCWTDEKRAERLEKAGFLTACVTEDESKVTCPAQLAEDNGKKWHCSDCARCGAGCLNCKKRVYFRMH